VAISLFRDGVPESYAGRMVEPCAIVRCAMDDGERVYVDAEHHACVAGAWQAGFIDPPVEIRSGSYLATNTPYFTTEGAFAVKNGENVLPRGTVRAIGAAPLHEVPDGVTVDWIVVVCAPQEAATIAGVRTSIDGTPPRGAAGTSLCGELFAVPWHDRNVIMTPGDVGGRMFNKTKAHEMFVLVPTEWASHLFTLLGHRPDLGGLLEAIKPGWLEAHGRARPAVSWDDDVIELMGKAPDDIREFAGPALEAFAAEHGHDRITMAVVAAQMESVGMSLEDILAMLEETAG
jgi:uncharacterized protein (DUF169 family)